MYQPGNNASGNKCKVGTVTAISYFFDFAPTVATNEILE